MVITQVITAGIKWVIGLLNPASAFVKAAMAIYDIVMFFVNRGSQIIELVKAVTESVKAIASGSVGAVAKAIEGALAKSVPVLIGFLASLLGIGGLVGKVQNIIKKIKARIDKAIDLILKKAKKHRTEPTKKLNQIPVFNDNYNALTSYIQSYAQRYKAKDIEQFLQQSSTLTKKEELKQIINKATHIPPSRYSRAKHWRGNSEAERRQNSANRGAGQFLYSMTPEQVK